MRAVGGQPKKATTQTKQDRRIVNLMMVTNHFFHSLKEWIMGMDDSRNQRYVTYSQTDLRYMEIL